MIRSGRVQLSSEFIDVAGHRAHVLRTLGHSGPTVVLLSSMFLLNRTYRPTLVALARRGMHAIAVQAPGSGLSSRLAAPWELEDYADWTGSFLETIRASRAVLIGHSNSGAVALLAGARHAARIAGVVACGAVGGAGCGSMRRIIPSRALDAFFEPLFSLRATPDAVYNLVHHPRNFASQIALARRELTGSMPAIGFPVLLAWGARDFTMPQRCADSLRGAMPGAGLYISQRGSHDWLVARADEFADVVSAWIASGYHLPGLP
jgi:pimeloyl-ACP methyl ester carboxylesterase